MMKSNIKRKLSAFLLLTVFSIETFYPSYVYALTSGPSTPEMSAFEPASTANMVDMFSGDFSYNIPLMDVGGYPLNLAYHSGNNPEEEASWVGFGWSLNPGAINRQLRGIPDDFKGDVIDQVDNKKPNITVGGNINVSMKLFGRRLPKIKIGRKKKLGGNMKIKIGISHNNYTGYKGIIGIGTSFNTTDEMADAGTKDIGPASNGDMSASLGFEGDSQNGINPYANFSVNFKTKAKEDNKQENSEQDATAAPKKNPFLAKQLSKISNGNGPIGKLSNLSKMIRGKGGSANFGLSTTDFASIQPPTPITTPMKSKNFTATLDLGITLFGGTIAPGIEGSYSKLELKSKTNSAGAYGFMNSAEARSKEDAMLDYNVEKESPYYKRLPNLGVPVFNNDVFSVTSNAGSMQFRSYLRGSGVFFQQHKHDPDNSVNLGLEPAFGNAFHLGVPLQINRTNTISGKWTSRNNYLDIGDFKSTSASDVTNQAFYFKRVGEKNQQDEVYYDKIGKTAAVDVKLGNGPSAFIYGNAKAKDEMRVKGGGSISSVQERSRRDKANHSILYLTATEAATNALQTQIPNYRENTLPTASNAIKNYISRTGGYRKDHHISQYIITQDDGQRMVYGTPVYNVTQQEVSFAVKNQASNIQGTLYKYTPGSDNTENNSNGKDNYFHKTTTPSYTTGHLLTGILSPDYVDVTSNGITDDDMGSAVKFNYSLLSDNSGNTQLYKWRTPYSNYNNNTNIANYNEGYRSVTDDDKASYTYGEKELWYLNSIESKTMVAQFITEDRLDGIGVNNENGGKNTSLKQKRLKEIRLYSKSDLYANGSAAVPIKVVHLEYDNNYPILNLVPNNIINKGKLTLKRVWFSYGTNTTGQYHSYDFTYNIPASQDFQDNQSDRWGNYKPASANPYAVLDNIDFPYAIQDKAQADQFASNWQLSQIKIPSGAIINIDYESDDYAYVQDKRAMQMCFLNGIGGNNNTQGFATSEDVYINLPMPVANQTELNKRYFDGMKSLAFKVYMDLDGRGHWEYVNGFAEIKSVEYYSSTVAKVKVVRLRNNKYNPIAKASWQKLKLELPRYAYPEYDNLDSESSGFVNAIRALGAAFSRFKDLIESFDKRSKRKGFGNHFDPQRSWVRLCSPNYTKLGGGHRVKEIRINDRWSVMSGVATAQNGVYGQHYYYTTEMPNPLGGSAAPITVSTGVAAYEPMSGGDENPFKEPINYTDKQIFTAPKYFYLERPMGESYFPGPSVGYSKVVTKNLGADGSVGSNGYTLNEFYTAKDFPTKVDELPMQRRQPKLKFLMRLFGAKVSSNVTVSQGYVVENNDMHGRPKTESVYGLNGAVISSNKYYYRVTNPTAEKLDLDNYVPVAEPDGDINPHALVGMDIDLFSDMNETETENMGIAIDPSFGIAFYGIIPKISVKLPWPKPNYEKRLYRGSTTIKLVNRYALLDKTVKTVNGSTSTTQNLLWDAETGEVLLTSTNNEFDDQIYSFNYPAHWMYDRMGSAFKNEGVYLTGAIIGSAGEVLGGGGYSSIVVPGDEVINLSTGQKFWVINTNGANRLIDKDGVLAPANGSVNLKIMRSGRRNLATASVGTIVSMKNPVVGTSLSVNYLRQIIQAKSVTYNEDWPMPVDMVATTGHYIPVDCGARSATEMARAEVLNDTIKSIQKTAKGMEVVTKVVPKTEASRATQTDQAATSCLCSCLKVFFDYLLATHQLFIQPSQNLTVGALVTQAQAAGYNVGHCNIIDNNWNKPFYALTTATTGLIYTAQLGDCVVSIRVAGTKALPFDSLRTQPCGTSPTVGFELVNNSTTTVTFPVSCTKYYVYPGVLPTPNIPDTAYKLGEAIYANSGQGCSWLASTQFNIPGISTLPANAIINSAGLYLYAYPTGFMPPTFPNAHSAHPGQTFTVTRITPNQRICKEFVNGGQYNNATVSITSPNQNVVVNMYSHVMYIRQTGLNYGFWSTIDGACASYATFANENYPNSAYRPKLVVNYSLPATHETVATLTIDDCVSRYCDKPVFNPYVKGMLGNWRVKKELLFDAKRVNNNGYAGNTSGTRLRNSGYFDSNFAPYWIDNGSSWSQSTNTRWQWTTEARKFNRKGQEIENVDALNRFGSAQYGYLQSVPVAVASNSMVREIGFDGFEDYNFNLGLPNPTVTDSCLIQDHFSFRNYIGSSAFLEPSRSHSGKYSLKLSGSITLEKPLMVTEPSSIYGITSNVYKLTNGYLKDGLTPVPGKKYVLNGWVYDGQPKSTLINNLTVNISGTAYNINSTTQPDVISKVYVVEGWKRFEITFTMPASGTFKLDLSGSVLLDDIRLHPYDGQLKSYVYDASSMRLMADLDENNFATFYEYDDEGTLIRVKKETERGISTIKETRSTLRKN